MSKELAHYQNASLDERHRYSTALASAGDLIPAGLRGSDGLPSAGKILLVMETGAMLGIAPLAAIQGIHVIEGRATISSQLMSGLIRAAGHKLTIKKSGSIPGGDYAVEVLGVRDDGTEISAVWDVARAVRAGLCKYEKHGDVWKVTARSQSGKVLPWEAYTEAMLKARAISEVAREGFDDVLKGIAYTSEEIESSTSIYASVEPDSTEDWLTLIQKAASASELDAISDRLKEKREGTDKIRAAWLARKGFLSRHEVIDAEVIEENETIEGAEA